MDERDEIEQVQPAGEQEPGGPVPPYEGRQTEMKDGYEQHTEKVFHGADDVEPGPGREISGEEREGVSATDTEAESPLGVGVSMTRRGEDIARQEDEEGREDTGTRGPTDRPTGVSDERAFTSVDEPDTESGGRTMPAGNQGG
ncbi:MAG TPA: hypothetical protein VFX88_19345 [Actinomycetota bacterium]|nr:hypothetical protein [Actinomycetota bacterium]